METYIQFSSVAQSCPTLYNPMNCSMPGLPVHHQLPEFAQTHVHRVCDAIQPSHPLSSPSLLPPIPPSTRVFSNESTLHIRWPKYWSFSFIISPSNEHPGLISFSICKIDSQREFAVRLRELRQRLCINLEGWDGEGDGREVQKGGRFKREGTLLYILMADSC